MGKPTLLVPGSLGGSAGEANPHAVPVEYITNLLRKKMPEFGAPPPQKLSDRVFIVKSKTGSGKSTVLPAQIFRLLRSDRTEKAVKLVGPGVVCTQPRILTAQTLARDQAADTENYPDLVLGVTIGYQTGPLNEKPASGLIYATAGSLLAQLRTLAPDDLMARYRFIIVDEAHERSLDTDTLLMTLKRFLKRHLRNPRLPFVILASATISIAKYAAYFEVEEANIVEVEGRAYGVETRWPKVGTNDYPAEAARVALEIHVQNPHDVPEKADILVFVPGKAEIEAVIETLAEANLEYRRPGAALPPFLLLEIHSEIISEDGRDYRLLKESPARLAVPALDGRAFLRPLRRIIVSTVVAETGLTIETLKYVVDCGWSRVQEVYYPGRYRGIITRPAPQSRIEQRKGRVGRKFPGIFYPLYTKNVYDALPADQLPEIVLEGASTVFLDIVAAAVAPVGGGEEAGARFFRVDEIDMLDPPPVDALAAALEEAVVFGYLRSGGGSAAAGGHELTRLGALAGRFARLGMHHVQTLLAGYLWRVAIRDLALIVALYDQRDALLYATPPPGHEKGETAARALRAGLPAFLLDGEAALPRARLLLSDDFLEALLAFEAFVRALDGAQGDLPRLLDWCAVSGIDFDGAVFLAGLRDEVLNDMIAAGLNPFWGDSLRLAAAPPADFYSRVVNLKRCIHAGLRFALLVYDEGAGAYRARGGDPVAVPPRLSAQEERALELLGAQPGRPPRLLVTNTVRLRGAKGERGRGHPPLLYRLHPGLISVLDGYVGVDWGLNEPRAAGPAAPPEWTAAVARRPQSPHAAVQAYAQLLGVSATPLLPPAARLPAVARAGPFYGPLRCDPAWKEEGGPSSSSSPAPPGGGGEGPRHQSAEGARGGEEDPGAGAAAAAAAPRYLSPSAM
jgi:hypothetical protein